MENEARTKEPNCREQCNDILELLTRANDLATTMNGDEGDEAKENIKNPGNLAVLEDQIEDIKRAAKKLVERLESLHTRI